VPLAGRRAAELNVRLAITAPDLLINVVEQFLATGHPRLVGALCPADAGYHMGDASGFGWPNLAVLQVHIVNNLPRLLSGLGRKCRSPQQHLKGAVVTLVRELAILHVVAIFIRQWLVMFTRNKLEGSFQIDKPFDQPGAGDAATECPGGSTQVFLSARPR